MLGAWWLWAGLAIVALGIVGVRLWRGLLPRPAPDRPGPMELDAVEAAVVAAGVPAANVVVAFTPDDALASFAQRVAGPAGGGPRDRAVTLAKALAARIQACGKPDDPGRRMPSMPRSAAALWTDLGAHCGRPVGSYEAAALALAAARAAGLYALPAEEFRALVASPPADPGGAEGRFVVLVYESAASDAAVVAAIDPLIGEADAPHEWTPLSDRCFAGRYYGLRALAELAGARASAALVDRSAAAALCPRDADVAATEGVLDEAIDDAPGAVAAWRRADTLRDDTPRRAGLGEALLAAGDIKGARELLRKAVAADPHLPFAHLALARLALLEADVQTASRELDLASADVPDLPGLGVVRAQLQAARGDSDGAEKALRRLALGDGQAGEGTSATQADYDQQEGGYALYGLLLARGKGEQADQLAAELIRRSPRPELVRARLREIRLPWASASGKVVAAPSWALPPAPASAPSQTLPARPATR